MHLIPGVTLSNRVTIIKKQNLCIVFDVLFMIVVVLAQKAISCCYPISDYWLFALFVVAVEKLDYAWFKKQL